MRADVDPEGLDVGRVRFHDDAALPIGAPGGEIVSVIRGSLHLRTSDDQGLTLRAGTHVFVPPSGGTLNGAAGAEIVRVRGLSAHDATGAKLILRDERFIYAASSAARSLRWILTPQYLSRRIFLRHDRTLVSRSGAPVSWFHTTMFDCRGLPLSADGLPVFKMSYNTRTEFNVCYDVAGISRVRMASHPYSEKNQAWEAWQDLDGESTYHLDESVRGTEDEHASEDMCSTSSRRNKHEIHISEGHVSLFCLFDPAPVGFERHRPGEYTDYEPYSAIAESQECTEYYQEIAAYDSMVDELSLAHATGAVQSLLGSPAWELYQRGRAAQCDRESELHSSLVRDGAARERVIEPWMHLFAELRDAHADGAGRER